MSSSTTILALLLKRREERNVAFRRRLTAEGRKRRDRRIHQCALQALAMSAFSMLNGSGSDQAVLTLTGLDHRAVRYLLTMFDPTFLLFTPHSDDGQIQKLSLSEVAPGFCQLSAPWRGSEHADPALC